MDKHDPLEDIFALRERISKISRAPTKRRSTSLSRMVPVVDIYETPEMFVVKADCLKCRKRTLL